MLGNSWMIIQWIARLPEALPAQAVAADEEDATVVGGAEGASGAEIGAQSKIFDPGKLQYSTL